MKFELKDKMTDHQATMVTTTVGHILAMLTASMHRTDPGLHDKFKQQQHIKKLPTTLTETRVMLRDLAKFMLDELRDYDVRNKAPGAPLDAETVEVREALKLLTAYKYCLVLDDHILGNIEMQELPEYLRNAAVSIEKHIAEAN